jgi:hypothetical protein
MLTDEQKARLPKAARNYIEVLEIDKAFWQGKYEAMLAKGESSRVVIPMVDREIPMDERTRIQFFVGEGHYDYVEAHLSKSGDEYFVSIRGGSSIAVHPSAGNAVEVTLK